MFIQQEFGKSIRKYRKEKSLTTAQLAEKINVSPGLINNIENAKYDVFKFNLLNRLLSELEVPLGGLSPLAKGNSFTVNEPIDSSCSKSYNNYTIYSNAVISKYISLLNEFKNDEEKIEIISAHIVNLLDTFKRLQR